MLNLKRELILSTNREGLIRYLKENGEIVKSFKMVKPKSIGGKEFIFWINDGFFFFIPNELVPKLTSNLSHSIKGVLTENNTGLKIVLSFSPPIWLSVILWFIISIVLIKINSEWYSITMLLFLIWLYVSNLSKCLKLTNKLVQLLINLNLPNIAVQGTARAKPLQKK